jgi:hypothetical protein
MVQLLLKKRQLSPLKQIHILSLSQERHGANPN